MKYFLRGITGIIMFLLLSPLLVPLFFIDMIFWFGGMDPLDTPIRKLIDKTHDKLGELTNYLDKKISKQHFNK